MFIASKANPSDVLFSNLVVVSMEKILSIFHQVGDTLCFHVYQCLLIKQLNQIGKLVDPW